MRVLTLRLISVACTLVGVAPASQAAGRAGWFGLCPQFPGFMIARQFDPPEVAAGKDPEAYRQTVHYFWTGGHAETNKVTLARDPAFKDRHAAATLRKDPGKPEEVKITGKFSGWLWKDGEKGEVRLVVPLTEDRALLLEYDGEPIHNRGLVKVAQMFDLAAVEAALAKPPRRTTGQPTIEDFRALKKGTSYKDVLDWLANFPTNEEKDRVSRDAAGNEVLHWQLADGSRVQLGLTRGFGKVVYVKRTTKDGEAEDLIK
jgi:hypothetical protein